MPDPGQLAGQGLHSGPPGGGEDGGLLFGEPLVVRLQAGCLGEGGLPVSFQLPGDEAVLGFGELVLAVARSAV